MSDSEALVYRRIVLKLSGEALMGQAAYGIDPILVRRLADEIAALSSCGAEVALVIGGGNICRGAGLAQESDLDRVTADQMGMLATVINALSMQDALEKQGVHVRVMSAIRIHEVCEDYIRRRAVRHLEKRRVVLFAAGTGNPFFTTDSAASLRAVEINADLLVKATKVDGVYSDDPMTHAGAARYDRLSYDEVIKKRLAIMDTTAVVLCRDNNMPMRVLDIRRTGALRRAALGEDEGTLVAADLVAAD